MIYTHPAPMLMATTTINDARERQQSLAFINSLSTGAYTLPEQIRQEKITLLGWVIEMIEARTQEDVLLNQNKLQDSLSILAQMGCLVDYPPFRNGLFLV